VLSQGGAEELTMAAATELTANVVCPLVTDTGWVTDEVRRFVEQSPDHTHVAPM